MIKKISILIITIIALVLLYASTKPDNFIVSRSIDIKASPKKIFPLIGNLNNWNQWSPYETPDLKKTFAKVTEGKGASFGWEGDRKVGKGTMITTDYFAPFKIVFKVNIEKPITAQHFSEFTLTEKNDETTVTWAIYGSNTYASKLMNIFFNCEKMIGKSSEDGLAKLKAVAEKQ